jgi:hypothetical protein
VKDRPVPIQKIIINMGFIFGLFSDPFANGCINGVVFEFTNCMFLHPLFHEKILQVLYDVTTTHRTLFGHNLKNISSAIDNTNS